ncbi:MAG: acyl carrier protein [Succinatimonas sp.]|nr:acyl carrier protein [Succinatimonas sp.]
MEKLSRAQILDELKGMMVKLFELDPQEIKPEASLFEDLDLDSIDAVDIIVMLQKRTGKKIKPEIFKQVKTVNDVVEAVWHLLNDENPQA